MIGIPEILVIDDEEADFLIVEHAAKKSKDRVKVKNINNGSLLLQCLEDPNYALPTLIFLDLNMPGYSGKELLKKIRANIRWKSIPVIVFSGSDIQSDIRDSYHLCANAYVSKPIGLKGYQKVFNEITQFWLGTARLVTEQ